VVFVYGIRNLGRRVAVQVMWVDPENDIVARDRLNVDHRRSKDAVT
jgi:hypothetical protein